MARVLPQLTTTRKCIPGTTKLKGLPVGGHEEATARPLGSELWAAALHV